MEFKKKKNSEINNLGSFVENLIIIFIIFVLILTVLDDIAIIYNWPISIRNIMLILGFAFDLIFTIEFVVRIIVNANHKNVGHYFFHQRGWVDLISSVPLLLLDSGPNFFHYLFGGASGGGLMLQAIKVVKAIRVTRILRLLRMIKILGKIHNTDSHMANRHIAVISTASIVSIIFVYTIFTACGYLENTGLQKTQTAFFERTIDKIQNLKSEMNGSDKHDEAYATKLFKTLLGEKGKTDHPVMQIYLKDKLVFSNYAEADLEKYYHYNNNEKIENRFSNEGNVITYKKGDIVAMFNMQPIVAEKTKMNIVLFCAIVFMVISFMTVYTRHFVQNVTDVVHVMKRGFETADFNLEVKVKPEFDEDEIFQLAQIYNEVWLPAKAKEKEQDPTTDTGGLTLDDFI